VPSAPSYNTNSGGTRALPETVVEFQQVVFCYDRKEVLHQVSFALRKGEIVGLLGPNGAGKSTTLKLITGILVPNSGAITVAGLPLPEKAVDVKQIIGYVPETAVLFDSLTGQEFLDAYSKGMRQKILIAAALLHNPDIILLDEPLSGLDVNAAILIKDLLAALAAAGKTILYSSHVLDVVERICDRVLIIHKGALIADGSAETLKASTHQATLEDVFRNLTDSAGVDTGVSRIIEALRP
jgi:ABC-2 type transport system ATP-binding protein